MEKIKLAVVGNTVYAERLAECLKKNAPEYLEVLKCRDPEQESVSELQPDIMLYEKNLTGEDRLPEHSVNIMLSDSRDAGADGTPVIFRYQRASEIMRRIFLVYGQRTENSPACWCPDSTISMAAVYAPGGHELQFPFSITYAAQKGKQSRVLYLNLAEFSGMNQILGDEEGENFSDLIYGIRQKKEKFPLCLESVLHHAETFDYVLPPGIPEDLYEIRKEDLSCLLSLLQKQSEYQLIVWNCGCLNQAAEQVMEHCSRIFCVVRENAFGKARKLEFEQYVSRRQGQKLQEKVKYISLQPKVSGIIQGVAILTQLFDGEFAAQVRKLTAEEA